MDERNDDLFLIDAEQAAQEVLQYGLGQGEFSLERLTATTEYLTSLLWSIGSQAHGDVVEILTRHLNELDDVTARRTARDLANVVIEYVTALKSGNPLPDQMVALQQIRSRFIESTSTKETLGLQDATEGKVATDQNNKHRLNEDLLRNATAALNAVDQLASLLGKSAVQLSSPGTFLESSLATASNLPEVSGSRPPSISSSDDDVHVSSLARTGFGSDQESRQYDFANADEAIREVQASARSVETERALHSDAFDPAGTLSDFSVLFEVTSKRSLSVDASFRKALAFQGTEAWRQGFLGMLEAIDHIDRIEARYCVPSPIAIRSDPQVLLGSAIGKAVYDFLGAIKSDVRAVEFNLSGHILVNSIEIQRPPDMPHLGLRAQALGGRVELDQAAGNLKLTIPASVRLIRLVPAGTGQREFAFSWAQVISQVKQSEGFKIRLLVGDHLETFDVDHVGAPEVAVRYELPRELWRRDQYKGIALTAQGRFIPIYG